MIVTDRDRTAGRAMQAVAVFGVVTSVVVAVVAWQFLHNLHRNLDRSLVIGEDAAATLTETIDVADDVIVALDDGLATIGEALEALASTGSATTEVAASTAELAASLPETFDEVDAALATVEALGGTIDGALRTASRLPLGPDYDPDVPFPDAVGGLRDALTPLGDDLDAIAVELDGFAEESVTVGDALTDVRLDVQRTQAALAESDRLLDRYRDTAVQAEELARVSRADADRSLVLARLALVPLTLLILVSQFVPWWLGRRLIDGASGPPASSVTDRTERTEVGV